ncbi:polyprenyl synthetase family protein [Calorimonas adulescens]|uniref:Polyprenyl synthetase family protein n=1 Tax=Calorimonas adulescens TaxID=2606906 RepID=A0A5D8QIB4_9THEO|nr:polyprenyl synthetase family protein [Calorimonas adulescens]TZE83606.1 polyprenyl synthetase family protein [Calorimonas adulescens]
MTLWDKYPVIKEEMDAFEGTLRRFLSSKNELIGSAISTMVSAGGKRLRPALTIASAHFGEYNMDEIMRIASSIEILHMATLIHDDIIDEAKTRRSMETMHQKYGVNVAIFAGDYLFSTSFSILSVKEDVDTLVHIASIIKSVCEGEIEQYCSRFSKDMSVYKYLRRIRSKTALLFMLSCELGANISHCSRDVTNSLKRFGMFLGMAFQIKDDILDYIGDETKIGKPVGNDLKDGIYTLPLIYAMEKDNNGKLKDLLYNQPYEIEKIIELVIKYGGIKYAEDLMDKYSKKAKEELNKLPHNEFRDFLFELTDDLVNREN